MERDDNILHVEVNVTDADSGFRTAPQFDYHIGSSTRYSGYREMEKMDEGKWKYDADISDHLPGAIGKMVFCRVIVKDSVGNLGIKTWEYEVTGEISTIPSTVIDPKPIEPAQQQAAEEYLDIKPVPVVPVEETKGKASSIVWTVQALGTVNVGERVRIKGDLKPKMNKSLPLNLTVIAPDDTFYVSRMDTDFSGAFEFSVPLTSEGEWKIFADWQGDGEYKAAKSKVLTYRAIPEKKEPTASSRTAQKTGKFLKKNTMIIGVVFFYILLIRLYRS